MEIEKKQRTFSVEEKQAESKLLAKIEKPKDNTTAKYFGTLSVCMGVIAIGVWFFSRKR